GNVLDLDHGQVGLGVAPDDGGRHAAPVAAGGERHGQLGIGAFGHAGDDVIVGQDVPGVVDDHAGADAAHPGGPDVDRGDGGLYALGDVADLGQAAGPGPPLDLPQFDAFMVGAERLARPAAGESADPAEREHHGGAQREVSPRHD